MSRKNNYYPMLDGLRGIAISLVLIHHYGGFLAGFWDQGYYGVDLFFVISGYLITSILLASREDFGPGYRTFLGRRTLRIFPVYYATLFVMFVLNIGSVRDDIFFMATYTYNYACQHLPGKGSFYLWSLSVEEQFYLFWPCIVLLLRKHLWLLLLVTTAIVCIGYAQLVVNLFPSLSLYNYTGLINRMGSLSIGALGAIWILTGRFPTAALKNRILEMGVFVLLIWTQATESKYRFPLMGICSLFLVLKCVHGDFLLPGISRVFKSTSLQYLGRVSYGVYLFHIPVGFMLEAWVINPAWSSIQFDSFGLFSKLQWHSWLVKLPINSAATVLLASASYHWFELPILSKKDVWFPPRNVECQTV